jgi:hypothetical protein
MWKKASRLSSAFPVICKYGGFVSCFYFAGCQSKTADQSKIFGFFSAKNNSVLHDSPHFSTGLPGKNPRDFIAYEPVSAKKRRRISSAVSLFSR